MGLFFKTLDRIKYGKYGPDKKFGQGPPRFGPKSRISDRTNYLRTTVPMLSGYFLSGLLIHDRNITLISFSSSSAARIWRAIFPSKLAAIRRLATTTEVSGLSAKLNGLFILILYFYVSPGSISKSYLCSLATIAAFFLAWSELSVNGRTRNDPQPPFSRASLHLKYSL